MANTDKTKEHAPAHHHPPEGTIAWFFYEFAPIVLFGSFFVLMCALPMFLIPSSATMLTPTKFAVLIQKAVLSPWALGIIAAFLGAFAVTFWATRWVGMYILAVLLIGFGTVFLTHPEAFSSFYIQWVFIDLLVFVVVALIFFPQKAKPKN